MCVKVCVISGAGVPPWSLMKQSIYVHVNHGIRPDGSVCLGCMPTVIHSFNAISCSARLPQATKFPITLFNSIFRFSILLSTWTEYNQALMPSSLPGGMPLSSLLRFHLHG